MTLRELLEGIEVTGVQGSLDVEVTGLAYDSRRVTPGAVFFALPNLRADGLAYARQAVEAGAAAVVGRGLGELSVTSVEVEEPRRALAQAAIRVYAHPSRGLEVVGVTGTNGKTTTTWMLESIFRAAGRLPGVIGTTGYRLGNEARPAPFTTPEAPELQGLLAEMRDRGVRSVAMEVSSHALVQRRAYGVSFDAVVFTNLTQDHLDYHGTMERYLEAKLVLFDGRNGATHKPTIAIVNADDPAAHRVREAAARSGYSVRTFSANEPEPSDVDLHVEGIQPSPRGFDLQVFYHPRPRSRGILGLRVVESEFYVRLPLLGRYNASNAAAAMTAAFALGLDRRAIVPGLETMVGVPGRLEIIQADPLVVVDYAHTPDALARATAAVRDHARGRVLLVFGCGGDRDRAKRPLMGAAAAAGADRVWVTNDNPRSEDPVAIARAIVAGAPGAGLTVVLDRREAIAAALAEARPDDVVLIAGKGHETTQTIGERVLPFDDRAVARELLGVGSGGPSGGRET